MSWQGPIGDKAQQSNLEPYTIADAVDFGDVPTAGQDGYAIVWDNSTGKFILAAAGGGGGTPGGSDTQVQYNNAGAFAGDAGLTYDAANDALTVAGRVVTGIVRPASDSTTAFRVQNAAGSTDVLTVDTTNKRIYFPLSSGRNWYIRTSSGTFILGDDAGGDALTLRPNGTSPAFVLAGGIQVGSGTLVTSGSGAPGGNSLLTLTGGGAGSSLKITPGTGAGDEYEVAVGSTTSIISTGFFIYNRTTASVSLAIKSGNVGIGITSPTALLDLAASTAARASLRIRAGTTPTTPNDGDLWNDGNAYAIRVNGTNAVNTDGGLSVWMQSGTTAHNVGRLLWQYTDKTDATRATRGSVTAYYTTTEHKPVTWGANSGGALLSFYDVTTPIARQVLATGAGATPDDIITALQALGLVKQS